MYKLIFWLGEEFDGITHERAHFDEYLAYFLINEFGDSDFARKYLVNGKIELGVNNGDFDDHTIGGEVYEKKSSAQLVAEALKVENDPRLTKLLRFAKLVDVEGRGQPRDMANIIKLLHDQNPDDPEMVMEWALIGISAKFSQHATGDFTLEGVFKDMAKEYQRPGDKEEAEAWFKKGDEAYKADKKAFNNLVKEYHKRSYVTKINSTRGALTLVVVDGLDDIRLQKLARSKKGHQADVIIQRTPNGNVQIFTDKRKKLHIDDVVGVLRYEEQKARGEFITKDWKLLRCDGKMHPVDDIWFFMKRGGTILNGSLTAPDVSPTKLDSEDIVRIVRIGLDNNRLPQNCRKYFCKRCSWHPWGLPRCRKINNK